MAVIESSGLTIDSSNWRRFANCDGIAEPESFPPGNGETVSEARIVCRGCVSALECLAYSRDSGVVTGSTKVLTKVDVGELYEERRLAEEAALQATD